MSRIILIAVRTVALIAAAWGVLFLFSLLVPQQNPEHVPVYITPLAVMLGSIVSTCITLG